MTLILDLREAALAIEADFSHLWRPQDTNCWYRPGALEPIISPGKSPFYVKNEENAFVMIQNLSVLPNADIYQGGRGLVVPQRLISTLTNAGTEPVRGLMIVQHWAMYYIWTQVKHRGYTLTNPREWYLERIVNPEVLRIENFPVNEYNNLHDMQWEATGNHWMTITSYMAEIESRIREFVNVNLWCSYEEDYRHYDMVLTRGPDVRVEFFEKYHYLRDQIVELDRKHQEEAEITRCD